MAKIFGSKKITRHIASNEEYDDCPRCKGNGLMPEWEREQSKPVQPTGTNCSKCHGTGHE